VKNSDWRGAADVSFERVEGPIIVDGTARVQAIEAGEVDALDGAGLPPDEIPRLKELPEYELYPALGVEYYRFNIKNISDVHQRRAMSLAINRQSIIDHVAQADQLPATGFTPQGISGFDEINPNSPWLLAVQSNWQELGIETTIKAQEWAQYLEFLGPPPNKPVDVFRLGWVYDFPDAINGLELWTCASGNNNTGFCNEEFDSIVEEARATPDDAARYELYAQLEQILFGQTGELPLTPIYYYTYPNLEKLSIKDSFNISPLAQIDLTKVVVRET
jgi:oligopeptide transport system substrate-binding protein